MTMFRILIKLILLAIIYFSVVLLQKSYDSTLEIILDNYKIESSIINLSIIFLIVQAFLFTLFLSIRWVASIPSFVMEKFQKRKIGNLQNLFTNLIENIISNSKDKEQQVMDMMMKKIHVALPAIGFDPDFKLLLSSYFETNINADITNLTKLLEKKKYPCYTNKKLAKIYYNKQEYSKAAKHGMIAFESNNDGNTELLLLLVRIYRNLELWDKMVFFISKMQEDHHLDEQSSIELSNYCVEASVKAYILLDNEDSSSSDVQSTNDEDKNKMIGYIILALNLYPYNKGAKEFLYKIPSADIKNNAYSNTTITHMTETLKIIFTNNPSLSLMLLFMKFSRLDVQSVYDVFAKISNPQEHIDIFFSFSKIYNLKNINLDLRAFDLPSSGEKG